MKKTKGFFRTVLILAIALGWTSCESFDNLSKEDKFDVSISQNTAVPGGEVAYKTGDNEFALKFSPTASGMKSTKGFSDDMGFWIGETEVTFGLWKEVQDWANDNAYNIESLGRMLADEDPPKDHPVAHVCWYDAVVWCNALTEYYNEFNGDKPDYGFVYTVNGEPIKDSDINNDEFENLDSNHSATGFRLPLNEDWYTAAKYKNTPDNFACGATSDYENEQANDKVAWYKENSDNVAHPVGMKMANLLGLYDMSGNVREYMSERTELFDGKCNTRGGGYQNAANYLAIGETVLTPPNGSAGSLGFRLARTIGDDVHEDIEIEENETNENDNGEGIGYFQFNGTKYDITSGVIKNYNQVGMKLLEVHLFSENIEPNSDNNGGLSGTGWMMDIGLHCTDEDLQDGKTYTEENCMMITMGAMVNVNTDIFPWEAENGFIGYVEYTLEVSKDGDEYTLAFSSKGSDYSFENNRLEFEGEYVGELPILNAGIDF